MSYPESKDTKINRRRKTLLPETPATHLTLFIATVFSVMVVYGFFWGGSSSTFMGLVLESFLFASALLAILLSHELGHYLAARYHGIDATLPYFIPAPLGIGTFGAFIQIKSRMENKRQLMDIGAAGPLAGFIVAVFMAVAGIYLSPVRPIGHAELFFGESLLFKALIYLIHGPIPEGYDLALTPIAFAAWIGFLITALNLIPASQLDGGHIIYSIFGKKHGIISRVVFLALINFGVWSDTWVVGLKALPIAALLTGFAFFLAFQKQYRLAFRRILIALIFCHLAVIVSSQAETNATIWLFWGGLLYFFRLDHPPMKDELIARLSDEDRELKLDRKRVIIGLICIAIFILTFMPIPIRVIG